MIGFLVFCCEAFSMIISHVIFQHICPWEMFFTLNTLERFFTSVSSLMANEYIFFCKKILTDRTLMRFLSCMCQFVRFQFLFPSKQFVTDLTLERSLFELATFCFSYSIFFQLKKEDNTLGMRMQQIVNIFNDEFKKELSKHHV